MKEFFALIPHSGLPYAVELKSFDSKYRERAVELGAKVFDSYQSASDAEYAANYPSEGGGLHPHGIPVFTKKKVNKYQLYVGQSGNLF